MAKLRVHNFSVSLDGYGAGPDQSLEHPLGLGGKRLHDWAIATATYRTLFGESGGSTGTDDEFARRGDDGIGATIMGRNMFGPVRGLWGDERWTGWWGDTPPFHHSVFVLTTHPQPPITMQGGTTFHFVDGGIHVALERAFDAAGGADVRLGGGVSTVQQYLRARLIDEMHLAFVPVLLGRGERLFDHLDGGPQGYSCAQFVGTPSAAHAVFVRDE
jgi:dihydrofolate reductase